HGRSIRSPAERFTALIAHRLERERRVERAVIDGHRYPRDVVTVAYSKDLTGVEDLAERTVIAHLEKLAVENRIRWDGTVARPP
ncbi:MAG: MBL fold metallo-hydrolase, partial [Halodesulfurarchaeum sp.]